MRNPNSSGKKALWFAFIIALTIGLIANGFGLYKEVTADSDFSVFLDGPGDVSQKLPWIHVREAESPVDVTANYTYTAYLPLIASTQSTVYTPNTLLVAFGTNISSGFAGALASLYGAEVIDQLPETNVYRWEFPSGTDIEEMQRIVEQDPEVRYAEPDYRVELLSTYPDDPYYGSQWALSRIQAPQAWDITRGNSEVVIAIVDTGIDLGHPDLASKLTNQDTWYDFGNGDNDPRDTYGHGTHCAGIAAATSDNSIGIAGMSWQTRIMPVKVFPDNSGSTTSYQVARGILHAANYGADVISLSLGSGSPSDVEREAIEYVHNQGVIVVAAAGNYNSSRQFYPAAFDHVISVASTTSDDRKSGFSNYGSWVDVSAPGSYILSTMPTYHVVLNDYGYDMNYDELSGTSMATPYVAGLTSLVLARHPGWSPDEVEARILNAADNIDVLNPGYGGLLGSGRINAYKAVEDPATPTPRVSDTPTPTPRMTTTPIPTSTPTPPTERFAISTALQSQGYPEVAYNPSRNEYLVIWLDGRNRTSTEYRIDIYGRRISAATGVLIGDDFQIAVNIDDKNFGTVNTMDIAYNPVHGEYLVVWRQNISDGSEYRTYARRISGTGGLIGGPFILSTAHWQWDPNVASNTLTGEYLVAWIDYRESSDRRIYGQRLQGDGQKIGGNFAISSAQAVQPKSPQVTYNPANNDFLIVWTDNRNYSALDRDIYARLVSSTGNLTSGEFAVCTYPASQSGAQVTYDGNNNRYLVAWNDRRNNDNRDIYAQILSSSGSLLGENFAIAASTQYSAVAPRISFNGQVNEYITVWRQTLSSSRGQRISSSGVLIGSEFAAGEGTGITISEVGTNGYHLIVWGTSDIYGHFYAPPDIP